MLGLVFVAACQGVNGLEGAYHPTVDAPAALVRTEGPIDFRWGQGAPTAQFAPEGVHVVWTGCIDVPSESMYPYVRVDPAGLDLRVDGEVLFRSKGALDPTRYRRGPEPFPVGIHPIEITYADVAGVSFVYVGWADGTGAHRPIPRWAFLPPGSPACPD